MTVQQQIQAWNIAKMRTRTNAGFTYAELSQATGRSSKTLSLAIKHGVYTMEVQNDINAFIEGRNKKTKSAKKVKQ